MFDKFFAKYARAVSRESERKSLYSLYCAKTVVSIVFYVLCIAIIAEALAFSEEMAEASGDLPFIVFGITLFLWVVSAIAALTLWLVFRSTYRGILNRAPSEDEMPEVASYRQKIREEKKGLVKAMRWAIAILVVGIIFMIVAVAVDIIQNPESEGLTSIGIIGIVVFGCSVLVFLLVYVFTQTKKVTEGKSIEMQTADEAKAIDAAQGRKHKYSLQGDKNAQTYRYLFPNRELFLQAKELRKKQTRATVLSTFLSCIVGIAAAIIFFFLYLRDWNLSGFAFPVFMTIVFVGVFFTTLPYSRRMHSLEIRQKQELETYPIYVKHLELYRKYEAFSKGKAKTLLISFIVCSVLAYGLAIAFPDKLWSVLSYAILFIGQALYNKFFTDLRKEARLIEQEIDGTYSEAKFRLSTDEDEKRLEVYQDIEVVYENNSLFCKNGGGDFSLYLGKSYLCLEMDIECKRISCFSGMFFLQGVVKKSIAPPENVSIGILYLDSEENFPKGAGKRIDFSERCGYDPEEEILLLGFYHENEKFYKILKNVYVQLSEGGKLKNILITGIRMS